MLGTGQLDVNAYEWNVLLKKLAKHTIKEKK